MTIRRQYSLPNCTLILEGLVDPTATVNSVDPRPLMTIIVNAECYFAGYNQPISGGRDFFESLVYSASSYAQEFLSQVHHPKMHGDKPSLVQFHSLKNQNLHRLTVLPTAEAVASGVGMGSGMSSGGMDEGKALDIDLTTVQLFDLVEAIDQFLADRQTLPDLSISLQPVSRRYRKADQPVAQRAAPAALGMASLTVAAIALFLVPVPEVRPPQPQPNATETTSSNTDTPPVPKASPPNPEELEKVLTSAQDITDPTEVDYLKRYLYRELDRRWQNRQDVEENLEYQVGVGKDGKIVGYKHLNDVALKEQKKTPLLDLLYIPTQGGTTPQEPIAQFRVVFTRKGVLQISPWRLVKGKAGLGPEITDKAVLTDLNDRIHKQLIPLWKGTPKSQKALRYRIGVTEDGAITDYEPINQPAWDYVQETPLEKDNLVKPEAAAIGTTGGIVPQKPLAQFEVVFKPNGVVEVSPLRGR